MHRALLLDAALVHVDRAVGGLALADDEDVRNLLRLPVPDLVAELLVRRVGVDAETARAQTVAHVVRVVELVLGDRHDDGLHRREPGGEVAGEVLDEHAEEALHRARQRAVDHDRPMIGAVGAAILELEAFGQHEVDLHGSELPLAADRVAQVDVELGPVERAAAFVDLVRQIVRLERAADRRFGDLVGRTALLARRTGNTRTR